MVCIIKCSRLKKGPLLLQDIGFDGISPLIGSDDNVVNVYWGSYFPKAVSPPASPYQSKPEHYKLQHIPGPNYTKLRHLQIAVDDILRKRGGKERLKYMTHVSCSCTFQMTKSPSRSQALINLLCIVWHSV